MGNDCDISQCLRAFFLAFNSSGLVTNCRLQCRITAFVINDVNGKIKFRNNTMVEVGSEPIMRSGRADVGSDPVMIRDSISLPPDHDFPAIATAIMNEEMKLSSDKEKSA